jgi:hypothetical protein
MNPSYLCQSCSLPCEFSLVMHSRCIHVRGSRRVAVWFPCPIYRHVQPPPPFIASDGSKWAFVWELLHPWIPCRIITVIRRVCNTIEWGSRRLSPRIVTQRPFILIYFIFGLFHNNFNMPSKSTWPNNVVEWLILLLGIRGVRGSNPNLGSGYTKWSLTSFSSVPPGKCGHSSLN